MRRRLWPVMFLAALTTLLAACGGPAGPDQATDPDRPAGQDAAGAWELTTSHPAITVPDGARITLEITEGDDGWQVGGTAACNSYGGTVSLDEGRWESDGYFQTEMGCEPDRMEAERAYLDALIEVDAWERPAEDRLELWGPSAQLTFRLLPPVPTAELTGTLWRLEGLISGTGDDAAVTSTAADAEASTLLLREDGTVQVATGCRHFSGTWEEAGDEVLLTSFGVAEEGATEPGGPEPDCSDMAVQQEDHVLSVLGDGFRVEVDGQRLIVLSRDGLGLEYRAEP